VVRLTQAELYSLHLAVSRRLGLSGQVLECAVCMYERRREGKDVAEADTVANGVAVCVDHVSYVQGGALTNAISVVNRT
jgi:hypothetical protein